MSPTLRATLIGYTAVLMWGTLSTLVVMVGNVPPFQATGLAFLIAFLCTLVRWLVTGEAIAPLLKLSRRMWGLGIFGLFGFHFFYFLALRAAPPVEALLIINLWPLLIVLLSTVLNGQRLHWWNMAGAAAGFGGAALITLGKAGGEVSGYGLVWMGYFYALLCAFIWALYSVLCRRWSNAMPKDAVGTFCGISCLMSLLCHLAFEEYVHLSGMEWLWIGLMGLGPVGLAFFTWDWGVKHGDIRVLGTLSYTGPLIGTTLLITLGFSDFHWRIAAAALLILGGAALGSLAFFLPRLADRERM